MNQLEYVFDKDLINVKGQSDAAAYVKLQFQNLMKKPQEQQEIFNVIWGNNALRENLFPRNNYPGLNDLQYKDAALLDFRNFIENTTTPFYNFIKVK